MTGNTLEDALRTIRLKKGPKGPDGKRWMGQTALTAELTYETSPSQDGSKLIVRVLNVRFDITVTLPYWDAAEGDEQAWNNLLGRLKKHEQGHVDRMRAGETQVKQQVIGTTFEIDKNATEQETVAAALSRVRGSQAYKDMEKANEDYDAPYDPENNPEGTNHGTENGQNVRPPHVGESGEEQAGEEEAGDGDGDEPDFDPRGFRVVPNTPETVTQCILAGGDPLRFRFRVENRTGAPLRNVTPQFVPTDGAPAAKFKRFVIPSKRNFLNGHSFRFEAITNFTRPYDNIAVTFEVVAQGPNGEEVKTGEFGCHAFD